MVTLNITVNYLERNKEFEIFEIEIRSLMKYHLLPLYWRSEYKVKTP